jgi:hypothetical protein
MQQILVAPESFCNCYGNRTHKRLARRFSSFDIPHQKKLGYPGPFPIAGPVLNVNHNVINSLYIDSQLPLHIDSEKSSFANPDSPDFYLALLLQTRSLLAPAISNSSEFLACRSCRLLFL